ncbi:MHC class I [Labeo rohita]|uniref:MHC class I n=1 Tax=Labeo rohita TaxID=84645 RepID=A0A498P0J2_LABRO|nr:MHC class I [Labeo rohita]
MFIPFYTGKVIDILGEEYQPNCFMSAIFFMGLLSLGRGLDITSVCRHQTNEPISDNVNILLCSLIKSVSILYLMLSLSWKLTLVTFFEAPLIAITQKIYNTHYEVMSLGMQFLMLYYGRQLIRSGHMRKHSLKYYYTGVSGIIDFPEFTAVGLVDDEQFILSSGVSAAEVSLISSHVSFYRFLPQWSNNHLAKKMDKNMDVKIGELLPNEDRTFQKTSAITVTPDEWKNKFICVVKHQGKTANEIRTNSAVILLMVIGVAGFKVYQKKKKLGRCAIDSSVVVHSVDGEVLPRKLKGKTKGGLSWDLNWVVLCIYGKD